MNIFSCLHSYVNKCSIFPRGKKNKQFSCIFLCWTLSNIGFIWLGVTVQFRICIIWGCLLSSLTNCNTLVFWKNILNIFRRHFCLNFEPLLKLKYWPDGHKSSNLEFTLSRNVCKVIIQIVALRFLRKKYFPYIFLY